MAIGTDAIVLSMTSPDTGEYYQANVYTVDGVYETDGVTLRRLSIGQLVMAICLQRAAELEGKIVEKMASIEDTSEQLELMTKIEKETLNAGSTKLKLKEKELTYNGKTYKYADFLADVVELTEVPDEVNVDSSDFITALEAKMDSMNSISQQAMIELQSLTNKRDQSYDMISNVEKSLNTVLVATVNNM